MYKVIEKLEPTYSLCEISHVERLVKEENKILVCVYNNTATFLICKFDEYFFYDFSNKDVHSRSESLNELLSKQSINEHDSVELFVFDSMREFFTVAKQRGWNY